jgi:hypothetical protein
VNPLLALPQASTAKLIAGAVAMILAVAGWLWLRHSIEQQGAAQCEAKAAQADAQRAQQQAAATAEAQRMEQQQADRRQEIEDAKDRQLRAVSAQLADALVQLRNRPERPASLPATASAPGACGTGAGLYAEDAGFLVREAARADELRAALDACQQREQSSVK